MNKKTSILGVRVPDELYVALGVIAEDMHVTVSYLVCTILTAFVDGYAKNNQ